MLWRRNQTIYTHIRCLSFSFPPLLQVAPREFVHGFAASCFRQGGATGTLRAILEGKTKEYLEGFKVVPEGKQGGEGGEGGEGGDGGESKEGTALFKGATASPARVKCIMVEPASPRPRRKGDDWLSHTVNVLSAGFISGAKRVLKEAESV